MGGDTGWVLINNRIYTVLFVFRGVDLPEIETFIYPYDVLGYR